MIFNFFTRCFLFLASLIALLAINGILAGPAHAFSGKGSAWVTSSPNGATIILDGANTNLTTPSKFDSLLAGVHTVILKREYCFDFTGQFEILPDSTIVFRATLQRPLYQVSNQHWTLSLNSVTWKPGASLLVGIDRQMNRVSQQVNNALVLKLVMGDLTSSPFSLIGLEFFSIDDSFYGHREPQYSLDAKFVQIDTLRQFEAAMISLVFLMPNLQGRAFVLRYSDRFGEMTLPLYEYNLVADVDDPASSVPTLPFLHQNYPNPFNPSTTIRYGMPRSGNISLKVFNALGQTVATLVDEHRVAGDYQVQWNANVPSGIYFYRLQAGEFVESKKMILLR